MNRTHQIYYHAIFGAIGGLLAWQIAGIFATGAWPLTAANAFIGAGAGFFIGGMLGAADGIVDKLPLRPTLLAAARGAAVGLISGAIGMLLGGLLFVVSGGGLHGRLLGWVLLGLLLGLGNGLVARSPLRAAYGAIGGVIAGGIGGLLYELITQVVVRLGAADATGMDNAQMIMSASGAHPDRRLPWRPHPHDPHDPRQGPAARPQRPPQRAGSGRAGCRNPGQLRWLYALSAWRQSHCAQARTRLSPGAVLLRDRPGFARRHQGQRHPAGAGASAPIEKGAKIQLGQACRRAGCPQFRANFAECRACPMIHRQ